MKIKTEDMNSPEKEYLRAMSQATVIALILVCGLMAIAGAMIYLLSTVT